MKRSVEGVQIYKWLNDCLKQKILFLPKREISSYQSLNCEKESFHYILYALFVFVSANSVKTINHLVNNLTIKCCVPYYPVKSLL